MEAYVAEDVAPPCARPGGRAAFDALAEDAAFAASRGRIEWFLGHQLGRAAGLYPLPHRVTPP